MRLVAIVLSSVFALYFAIVGLMFVFQRDLMYFPDTIRHVPPSHYDMLAGVQEVELNTPDGLNVLAWYAPPPLGRPTVAIFHGNGGSLRGLRYRLAYFKQANVGVLLLAYRGYSGSDGTPTEEGLYIDARTALNWLNAQGIPDTSIALYGESLGSGVATRMAAEREVGIVVLESPYTSTVDVAEQKFPFLPVSWLMSDRYESLSRIKAVSEPLLIMHGAVDQVVPQDLGRRLFAAANQPKEGFWPQGAGHGDIFDKGGFTMALAFINRHFASAP